MAPNIFREKKEVKTEVDVTSVKLLQGWHITRSTAVMFTLVGSDWLLRSELGYFPCSHIFQASTETERL